MSEDDELKPCPFCGGKAEMKPKGMLGFTIKCKLCHVQVTQKVLRLSLEWLRVEMIKHWNTRITP